MKFTIMKGTEIKLTKEDIERILKEEVSKDLSDRTDQILARIIIEKPPND